ncbi:MAG: energy transducer TonB family protein [Alkalilacustris sp.]
MATWGGLIRAHIMRRSPRAPAAGQVLLRLDISADGTLRAAELARSSGTPALDRAALAAVRAAGRFPPAPAALGGGVHRFTLPLRFD